MKLAQLLEGVSRSRLLKLQQYLIDHVRGELDVKLGKDDDEPCLYLAYSTLGLTSKLKLILENDPSNGWRLYVWDDDEWRVITGSGTNQDYDDIAAEVQSYTYGPQG